jgi:iron complex outermembrane receptor protein
MNKQLSLAVAALAVCVLHFASANAQQPPASADAAAASGTSDTSTGLEEVVVTAQRREETAQRAAISISTVSGAEIAEANVTRPGGLTQLVPALQIADDTGPYSIFYLRGVGSFAANALSDSAVAFNFDNVFVGRPSSTAGFFYDLQRVEVLNGPQGTLYGRNATGGAINVISNQPVAGQWVADASAEYGNYSYFRTDEVLNAPLGDTAAVRVAFFHAQHNGYLNDGTDDEDDTGGRISFKITPTDALNILVVGDYFKQEGLGVGSTVIGMSAPFPGPTFSPSDRFGLFSPEASSFLEGQPNELNGRTFAPFPNQDTQNNSYWGISSTINWTTPIGDLTVIPAYRDSKIDYISYAPGFQLREIGEDKQTSFEARLASNDEHAIRYLIGVFYYDEPNNVPNFDVNQQADTSFQTIDTDTVSRAVFGRLTYAFTPAIRITGGARYTQEDKDFSGSLASNDRICAFGFLGCPTAALFPYTSFMPAPPSPFGPFGPVLSPDGTFTTLSTIDRTGANQESASYSRVTWRAGADWDITEHNLLYASVETGFKAGGFFFTSDNGYYKPETIRAYTLGSKNRFLDNKLQLNLEVYYWKYTDQQISHLGLDSQGTIIFPTENVGSATYKGAELALQARPLQNTLLSADVQYNDGVYDSFIYHTPNSNGGAGNGTGCPNIGAPTLTYTVNCSGMRPPYAPLWTIAASAQQTVPLPNGATLIGNVRVHYQSDTLTALDFLPAEMQGGYALTDFEFRYSAQQDRYFVAAYVNNAFDKTALSFSYPVPLSFFVVGALQPPRTYGVRAGVHF